MKTEVRDVLNGCVVWYMVLEEPDSAKVGQQSKVIAYSRIAVQTIKTYISQSVNELKSKFVLTLIAIQ